MSQEKDEKGRPVEGERHHDEKGGGGMDEKYRRDPFSAVFFGLIIILAGVLWFLNAQNYIAEWWPWFLIGLGSILILERLIRNTSPAYRRPMFGRTLFGAILICVGIAFIYGLTTWWPLVVIAIGVAIIILGISRGRKPKA